MADCAQETCFWSDGVGCSLGHLDPAECPARRAAPANKQDDNPSREAVAMPWSGGALGLTDIGFVAGRSKPIVLAIIGPQNAGKTTLLGAWYLLLGHGHRPEEEARFSGSCSLAGWEVVASSLRWEPGSIPPAFPAHTSSHSTRIPGLLHLAFKTRQDHRRDYVMTDAPGEWFRKWAVNRDAPDAEGARWAAEHGDAFLLVVDRESLTGPEKGVARSGVQLLARRLAGELRDRPVALVWTKEDVSITKEMENAVRSAVLRVIPEAVEFAVSIKLKPDGAERLQGFLDLLGWVLSVRRPTVRMAEPTAGGVDPFSHLERGKK